jgi:RND family efflux transporter MFP subunit
MPHALLKKPKRLAAIAGGIVLLTAGGLAFRRTALPDIPMAEVRRGDFVEEIFIRGKLEAARSIQLTAPTIAGDLQIVKLAPMGSTAKKGDVVVQFDPTILQATLAQKQSDLRSADANIGHSKAEARLTREQQATDLLQGRYDVERARLDSSKQEILSEIDGAETKLKLADAEQKYKELQQKEISTKDSTEADVDAGKYKREKALLDVHLTQKQLASLTLRAPADGTVVIMTNQRVRNWTQGGDPPDFKEGDRAWPGAVIAQLPDLTTLRVSARVDENDRGRIKLRQQATVRIDAIADREFPARVVEISPLAKQDFSAWPITKNFDIALEITENDARIRPGMSAGARIAVETVPNGILVPIGSVFEKNGNSVVYIVRGSRFEERRVDVVRRGKTQLLIGAGLQPGDKVAMKDPGGEKQDQ